MTTEDRLTDALRTRATSVEPSGDGWARIESRINSPRRSVKRWIAIAVAALAIPGAVAVNAAINDDDAKPLIVSPGPSTTTSTTAVSVAAAPQFVFPAGDLPAFDTPEKLADAFARNFLGMPDPTVGVYRGGDAHSGEIDISPTPPPSVTTTLLVRENGSGWHVVTSATDNLQLDSPAAGDTVSSPMRLSGRSVAFEGVVHILLLPHDGSVPCARGCAGPGVHFLFEGTFTGNGTELTAFEHSFTFDPHGETYGVLILWTDSARDGSLAEATVRLVRL